jgi:predicted transcriptional regulator
MSAQCNVVLSDELNKAVDAVVNGSETTTSEMLRKALQLYLAAREGSQRGLKLGLIDRKTQEFQTEIIGLCVSP